MLHDILNRSVIYRIVAQLYRKYLLMKQLTLNDTIHSQSDFFSCSGADC